MICSVNKQTKRITVVSILRDTHLDIPDHRESKVNAAYAWGGANLLVQTIEHNFGIKIDDYATVNFEMFTALVDGLGGIEKTKEAIAYFREQTKQAGFPDLHLQITIWDENAINLSGFDANKQGSTKELVALLGADSVTHYQFVHFVNIDRDYLAILEDVKKEWQRIDESYSVPYYPHVSCGWDNNPRYKRYLPHVMTGNTPEAFERALRQAKEYIDTHNLPAPLVTVNSWNEWTETSYLIPDGLYGYGYLEAIKKVFVDEE
jgi:LCP family protein required for cell wall assembly